MEIKGRQRAVREPPTVCKARLRIFPTPVQRLVVVLPAQGQHPEILAELHLAEQDTPGDELAGTKVNFEHPQAEVGDALHEEHQTLERHVDNLPLASAGVEDTVQVPYGEYIYGGLIFLKS